MIGSGRAGQNHVRGAEQDLGRLVRVHQFARRVLYDDTTRQCIVKPPQLLGLERPATDPSPDLPGPDAQYHQAKAGQRQRGRQLEAHQTARPGFCSVAKGHWESRFPPNPAPAATPPGRAHSTEGRTSG